MPCFVQTASTRQSSKRAASDVTAPAASKKAKVVHSAASPSLSPSLQDVEKPKKQSKFSDIRLSISFVIICSQNNLARFAERAVDRSKILAKVEGSATSGRSAIPVSF